MFDSFEKVEDRLQEYCNHTLCSECKFKELCDAINELYNKEKYPSMKYIYYYEDEYYRDGGYS